MKKVLLYYNFSYPVGGGDYLPLLFASYLKDRCDVTLAVDLKAGFEKSAAFFKMDSELSGLRVVQLMPEGYTLAAHDFRCSLHRSRQLKKLAAGADVRISTCNVIDFGKPGRHFINIIDFGDDGFADYVNRRRVPLLKRMRRSLMGAVLRPIAGMRSKRVIIGDPRERIYPNSGYVERLLKEFYGPFNGALFYPPTTFTPGNAPAPARDPLKVVYIGRFNPKKRIPDIAGAVERARAASGLDLSLHLAGPNDPGEYGSLIRRMAEEKPWIRLVGPVYGEEKETFLRSGTYAIHAERDEAFGISVTEYLKAGCIPIVPDEGGTTEIVDSPALTYASDDEAAAILTRLLQDEAFREAQRTHCAKRAEAFSMRTYMENQRRVLDGILADAGETGRPASPHLATPRHAP